MGGEGAEGETGEGGLYNATVFEYGEGEGMAEPRRSQRAPQATANSDEREFIQRRSGVGEGLAKGHSREDRVEEYPCTARTEARGLLLIELVYMQAGGDAPGDVELLPLVRIPGWKGEVLLKTERKRERGGRASSLEIKERVARRPEPSS